MNSNNLAQEIIIDEHFIPLGGSESWTATNSGGTQNSNLASDSDHPGIQTFSCVSALTDRAQLRSPVNAILLGGGTWLIQGVVQIITLSNATDEFTAWMGLFDANASQAVDGVYFFYDRATSGNVWICVTSSNSTRTKTVLANSVTAGTWVRLGIEISADGTRVKFFIDGVLVATHTANIPTTAGRVTGVSIGFQKTAGTAALDLLGIDHLLIHHIRTTPLWTV